MEEYFVVPVVVEEKSWLMLIYRLEFVWTTLTTLVFAIVFVFVNNRRCQVLIA